MPKQTQITPSQQAYEDACKVLGIKPSTLEDFAHMDKDERLAFFSLYKIRIVIKARRQGRKLNMTQRWWFPWFMFSGRRWSFDHSNYGLDVTGVGSRLSSETEAEAKAVAKLMPDEYNNWISE